MPTLPTEPFRVAVYCHDNDQLKRAEEALRAIRPDKTRVYSDVVDGWVTRETLAELTREGLLVDITDPLVGEEEPETALAGEALLRLDEFRAKAHRCSLSADRGFVEKDEESNVEAHPGLVSDDEAKVDVYWVQFKRPLAPHRRSDLEQRGIEISGYEPPNWYKMFLTHEQRDELQALTFVAAIERYTLEQTVTSRLVEQATGEPAGPTLLASSEAAPETFDCILHRPKDEERVRTILERTEGVDVLYSQDIFIRFRAPADAPFLAALARLPEVRKLAPYSAPRLFVDHVRRLVGIETINSAAEKWTGSGELVGVFDSGVDQQHPDLVGRVRSAESLTGGDAADQLGHGTHVAGIIAGTGASSDGALRGVAPEAELLVVRVTSDEGSVEVPPDLGELLASVTDSGVKVVNLSWGEALHGDYDFGSLSIDKFVCEHPDVLVVIAAGNAGKAPQGYVEMQNIYSPASAKNAITVGASTTDRAHDPELRWGGFREALFPLAPSCDEFVCGDPDLAAAISSRGPTDFDTVKPDVLAPGTFILSARASDVPDRYFWEPCPEYGGRYAYNGGTSMATPVVSGVAAVLRQYLRKERPDVELPSAALIKAILLASAIPLPSARPADQQERIGYPDFDQGFGRVDLSKVLPGPHAPGRRLEFADVASASPDALESRAPVGGARRSARTYVVEIKPDATEVRIVLTWTDLPGRFVQNNLELDVRGPGGLRRLGNSEHKFHKDPLFDDPELTGVIFDKRNSVEQVLLTNPTPGRYRLRIWGENTLAPQGYALCVAADLAGEMTIEA